MHLRMVATDSTGSAGMPALSSSTLVDYVLLAGGIGTCVVTTTLTILNHKSA